jgi:1,4-dihydroxy-2-naphthoate octaprenyltransferase
MWNIKKFILSNFWEILGGIFGGFVGYFYWRDIGCSTGTCPITSKPLNSILYFAFLGYLFVNIVSQWRTQKKSFK